jgi:16S rRNA processing protein RimM
VDRSRIVVAELLRPRGNRGELLARSLTDVPGRLEALREAKVHLADGTDSDVQMEAVWPHRGEWVVKFSGVDTIDQAERFRGADLWVPPEQRAALTEGEYFQSDLIGCRLVDAGSGSEIGRVLGFEQYGGPPLMEVEREGRQVLVPFVRAYCRSVDLAARTIVMELPEGLLEL